MPYRITYDQYAMKLLLLLELEENSTTNLIHIISLHCKMKPLGHKEREREREGERERK